MSFMFNAIVIAILLGALWSFVIYGRWRRRQMINMLDPLISLLQSLPKRYTDKPIETLPTLNEVGYWGDLGYRVNKILKHFLEHHRQTQSEFSRLIKAFEASPNGMLLLGEQEEILWANAEVEQHLGVNPDRDRGQPITHLVRQPELLQAFQSLTHSVSPLSLVIKNTPLMSGILPRAIQINIIPYDRGQKLLISQDISDRLQAEALRTEFVANVSHELKTPITVLAGALENMRDLSLSVEDREVTLQHMEKQVRRLTHLIDEVLTLARLEAEPPSIKHPITISSMIEELYELAITLSGGKHIITREVEPTLMLRGVEQEIFTAFQNIISNAIRYSPNGGNIRICWHSEPSIFKGEENRVGACFSVQDEGVGIAPEWHHRLTERFYRVDTGRSVNMGGTGLGLAIVKHVLMRHHGKLMIESVQNKGSIFSLHFSAEQIA